MDCNCSRVNSRNNNFSLVTHDPQHSRGSCVATCSGRFIFEIFGLAPRHYGLRYKGPPLLRVTNDGPENVPRVIGE